MQRCFCWLCILTAILGVMILSAGSGNAQSSPFKTKVLANGLTIIVIENPMVPLATVEVVAKNGGFTEPPEYSGLSHLYEHMFFKANAKYPSQEKFLAGMQSLGASLGVSNATTHQEHVNYYIVIPNKNLHAGMDFMSTAIQTPVFDTAEIRKERYVVLGEFDRNEASPLFKIRYAMDSAVWSPELFSRKEQLGLRPTILSATPEMMHTIQHRFYIPNNMALIVAGDVQAQDVFDYAEKSFGSWKRGDNPFPKYNPPSFPPLTEKKLIIRDAAIPYSVVTTTWHGPSLNKEDEDTYCADLFSTIVNQPNSRFQKKLVESGLALQANVSYFSQHNVGPIDIRLVCRVPSTKKAIDAMMDEIKSWDAKDYFSDEELATAKGMVAGDRIFEQESASGFATQSAAFWWASASLGYYDNYVKNMQRVTRADLARYVDRYIKNKNYVMGVAANTASLQKLALKPEEVLK